jgi:hypothetical protein
MPEAQTNGIHYNMDIPVITHYYNGNLEYLLDNNELNSVIRNTFRRDICYYYYLTSETRIYKSQGFSAIQIPEKKSLEFYENRIIEYPSNGCNINWIYNGIKQSIAEFIKLVFSEKGLIRKININDFCITDRQFSSNTLNTIYEEYFNLKNSYISFRFYKIENSEIVYLDNFNNSTRNVVDYN